MSIDSRKDIVLSYYNDLTYEDKLSTAVNFLMKIDRYDLYERCLFVIKFFVPFWMFTEYIVFILKSKLEHFKHVNISANTKKTITTLILIFFLFILVLIMNVYLSKDNIIGFWGLNSNTNFPIEGLAYTIVLLISFISNHITIYFIKYFAQNNSPVNRYSGVLSKNLNEKLNSLSEDVDNLFGHQVFAGESTYNVLFKLLEQQKGKKSKAFILRYLAQLLDDRIEENDHYIMISNKNNRWPNIKYSHFLANNMDRAEESVIWVVSPKDFYNIMLPDFIGYYLISNALAVVGEELLPASEKEYLALKKLFPKLYKYIKEEMDIKLLDNDCRVAQSKIIKEFDTLFVDLRNHSKHRRNKNEKENDQLKQAMLFNKALETLKTAGFLIYKLTGNVNYKIVKAKYYSFECMFINKIFPHYNSFRRSNVQQKERVLLIGDIDFDIGTLKSSLYDALSKSHWTRNDIQTNGWSKLWTQVGITHEDLADGSIIEKSLDLFKLTCGGEDNISFINMGNWYIDNVEKAMEKEHSLSAEEVSSVIVKLKEEINNTKFENLDMGIYDREYIVSSEHDLGSRKIDWYFGINNIDKAAASVEWMTKIEDVKVRHVADMLMTYDKIAELKYEEYKLLLCGYAKNYLFK